MRIRINLFQFVAIILSVATLCESAKASLRIIPIRFFLKISGISPICLIRVKNTLQNIWRSQNLCLSLPSHR